MTQPASRLAHLSAGEKRELLAKLVGKRGGGPRRAPLSFGQERLWFVEQFHPGLGAYHVPLLVRLRGGLDRPALGRAVGAIVARHETLRTRFEAIDGKATQIVQHTLAVALPTIDLGALPPVRAAAEARWVGAVLAGQPFDLRSAPPCRWCLVRLSTAEHLLEFVAHHIIVDAWSTLIVVRELSYYYDAFARRLRPLQPPLPVQYADFAIWQRQRLRGEYLEAQLAYWKAALQGCPVLELPADRPRPPLQTFRGSRRQVDLAGALLEDVRGYSRRAGATLFVVLLAAFKALLFLYSGQQDVVVGSPVTGRDRKELEELIGFFVNSLVVRTSLAGQPSFAELVSRVRDSVVAAVAHRDMPFEKLVLELHPARDLQRSPIFQVAVALLQVGVGALDMTGVVAEVTDLGLEAAKFDLNLDLREVPDQLVRCYLEYNSDLFDSATAVRMLGHYRALLAAAVADPDRGLAGLQLLAAAEAHQVLVEWNDTPAAEPRPDLFHRRFEAWARSRPEAVAVALGDERLGYRELDRRANRIARLLRELGVGPNSLVGLAVADPVEGVAALLGVLKAGAAYLPLDLAYPPERLAFMIEDSGLAVLLTSEEGAEALAPAGSACRAVRLDLAASRLAAAEDGDLQAAVAPADLAYVIYTSGSTGRAKAALLTHQGLANLVRALLDRFEPRPGDAVLQFASLSFDASVWEIVLALASGATLRLVERGRLLAGAGLGAFLAEHGITHTILPPSSLAAVPVQALPRLRALIAGGEECPPELAARWSPARRFFNAYGPTEITVCATLGEGVDRAGKPLIGRPLTGVTAYVLGRTLAPVPLGTAGELFIGGEGLARGYLGRPALTAERFVPDPFAAQPGRRLYRTGDLARYRPDGSLDYRGRADRQVKVRGFRIEPHEVESALLRQAGVLEAAVVAAGEGGGRRLVAYLVWAGEPAATGALRERLGAELPAHLVPSLFVALPSLPRTPSGKLDRAALPPPGAVSSPVVRRPPRTELERGIAAIWCRVLELEQVDLDDNFFEVGGHSLLLVQAQAELSRELGREVPLLKLFEHPSIHALAEFLAGEQGERGEQAAQAAPGAAPLRRPGAALRRRTLRAAARGGGRQDGPQKGDELHE